jgi:hypothetical protein
MGAMTGAQKLLDMWYAKAKQDYANESPAQAAPIGLLLNYMENPANSIQERWNTFAMYVQQGATADQQNLLVSGLLSLKNAADQAAMKAWRWPLADQAAALSAMTANSAAANWYLAYQALGKYLYKGKPLPLTVGASVALKFIAKINTPAK